MASSASSSSLFSPLSPLQTPSRSERGILSDLRLGFRRTRFFRNSRTLIPTPSPQRNSRPDSIRAVQTDRTPSRPSNEGGGKEDADPIERFLKRDYSQWGFVSDVESVSIPKGLNDGTIRLISAKKGEPEWMLQLRLRAFRRFQSMREPHWSDNCYPPIDLQSICL